MLRISRRLLRAFLRALAALRRELRCWGLTTDERWWHAAAAWTFAIAVMIASALTNPQFPAVHV